MEHEPTVIKQNALVRALGDWTSKLCCNGPIYRDLYCSLEWRQFSRSWKSNGTILNQRLLNMLSEPALMVALQV
jgi:hypothetical protein